MRKIIITEIVIIVLTLVIVLPLVFLAQNASVTENSGIINGGNADRYLSFDLLSGQTVIGSYIVDPINGTELTSCIIIDPNGNEMISSPTYYDFDRNNATFSFTANMNGRYYLSISLGDVWTHFIDYEYSISSPLILGVDPLVLIGLMITIAAVLTLINALWNLYLPRRRKNMVSQKI